jgi:TonB family protein
MSSLTELKDSRPDSKVVLWSAIAAFVLEFVVLTGLGIYDHWLAHPQKQGLDPTQFVEAEMVQVPDEPKLEEKKVNVPGPKEVTLSKEVGKGREAKPDEKQLPESNQTTAASPLGPTHGPVSIFAPQPVIPTYLQNQNLHTSVVIDFFVTALGAVTPKLVGSSGNEELDALALGTAKKWQFRPAEKDHKPLDAKVRLRIIFEVK